MALKLIFLTLLLFNNSALSESLSEYQRQIQGKLFFNAEEIELLRKKNLLEKFKERPIKNPYEGPIIDVHNHPNYKGRDYKRVKPKGPKGAEIVQINTKNQIVHTIVMNTPGDYRSKNKFDSVNFAKNHKTVSALCRADVIGMQYKRSKSGFKNLSPEIKIELKRMKKNLKNKNCIGIGEIGPVHYNKHAKTILPFNQTKAGQGEILLNLDHEVITKILELANLYQVPAVFHIEPFYILEKINREKSIIGFYKKICIEYPNAKIILAHLGHFSPASLSNIFDTCENVFADFKLTHSWGLYWGGHDLNHPSDLDFRLHERWATFFEKYPNRIMYGSDWKLGRKYSFDDFPYHIDKVRLMIGSLNETTQEKIMYSNAKKIFNLLFVSME